MQCSATVDKTAKAKERFELHMESMGTKVKHCHADNGIFTANKWGQHCTDYGQTLTFARVGVHHQNGVAERKTRDLMDFGLAVSVHAIRKWPEAITTNLWPCALRMACDNANSTPFKCSEDNPSPLQQISSTLVATNWNHHHSVGAPTHDLPPHLQQEPGIHGKWDTRTETRPLMHSGLSSKHARMVGLALDMQTAWTSLQFHIQVDDNFDTVHQN